jgi:GH18 family chitinase
LLVLFAQLVSAQFKVVGYLPSWAGNVSDVQFSKLTHINYAFALPTSTGGLQGLGGGASKLQSLVSAGHTAGKKVLIAVGGWNNGDDAAFRALAANATYRTNFVNACMSMVNQYNLDGVDIDWEYPTGTESPNFTLLMQQLSNALHAQGKLLTAAVVANGSTGDGIQTAVFGYIDFLNIMAYDGGGSNHSTYNYAVQSLSYWKGRGLPTSKAILGVPFYGRSATEYVGYDDLLVRGASPTADSFNGVGYNGIPTIKSKTNLAFDQGGGIMIWDLSDDARNANSLLTAIDQVVQQRGGGNPGCVPVAASSDDGNVPANVLDNDLNTRWSANGDGQWIQFCLSTPTTVTGVQVAFYSGNTRTTTFDVQTSGNGTSWTNAATGLVSSGTSLALETFSFTPRTAQYVRIVGHGNSVNAWNSLSEVKVTTEAPSIPVGQTVWLRGFNNQYVSSKNGVGPMWCNATAVAGWNQFLVVDAGGGKVALQNQSLYVSSENGTQAMTCNRPAVQDWEKFDWIVNTDGTVSLRGSNGQYVSSENGTQAMTCNRPTIGGWESFAWGVATPVAAARIAPIDATTLTLYPNEVSDKVNYVLPAGASVHEVKVVNLNGEVVYQATAEAQAENTIEASAWKRGIYYVTISTSGFTKSIRIIKN